MASAQQGRNRMLFKVGKVSIITDTLPVFLHIMLDLLGFLYPFRPISAIWVEISNKLAQESLPFCTISAVWVEICERRLLESLPFSTDFRCLGREIRPAATGISTLFDDFKLSR